MSRSTPPTLTRRRDRDRGGALAVTGGAARPGRRLPRPAGFAVAAVSLVAVFLSSGTPVPLYNTYRVQDGITDADLALTTVAYLAVTALSLLLLGRLSDHLGRRPVAVAALVASLAGCLVLARVDALGPLVAGRVLQGLACGVASSALGAMVVDLAPRRRVTWLPAVITSSAPPFAIPLGALGSGVLVDVAPAPRSLGFEAVAVVLAACAAALLACPEPVSRRPGALASLRPKVLVPAGAGRPLLVGGAGLVATWSFTGYYQAFAPGLSADYLGTGDALVIAAVFASIVVLTPLGGLATGGLAARPAQRLGLVVFCAGVVAAVTALHAGAIAPFLIASALAGVAQGAANSAGMRGVLSGVAPAERAGTLATLYLICYAGGAVPGLVAGRLTSTFSLPDLGTGYAALSLSAAAGALLLGLRRAR